MNKSKMAGALNAISVGFGELAEAILEDEAPQATRPVTAAPKPIREASPFDAIAAEIIPEGSLANCPKHHVPFTAGTYGPYCQQATDDPAWGKQKGDKLWCKITPKNAADWLRITAAA